MSCVQVTTVGDSAAILLPHEILESLGLKIGDEIDWSVANQELRLRSRERAERAKRIDAATDEVFAEYGDVLRQLAEGAR